MKRIAALYDVHGNLPALEAVLAEIEAAEVEMVLVGGDIAAGPMPGPSLERLRGLGDRVSFVRGNADREAEGDLQASAEDLWGRRSRWVAEQLTGEQRAFLGGLPEVRQEAVEGLGSLLFCHGTPRSDEEIVTIHTTDERLQGILAGTAADVIVCGHTHAQFDRWVAGVRVVNAGSVGLPYEGRPGAYWALLGPEVWLIRTDYDIAGAAAAIRATDFPGASEHAEDLFENPPDRDEVATFFEDLAARRGG